MVLEYQRVSDTRAKIQFWFFKELSDEQRMALIRNLHYPAYRDGHTLTMNEQRKLLQEALNDV